MHLDSSRRSIVRLGLALSFAGCGDDGANPFDVATSDSSGPATTGTPPVTTAPADTSTSADPDESGDAPVLDVGFAADVPGVDPGCTLPTPADIDPDGAVPCADQAPPNSFDAEVQWSWDGG